MHSRLQSRSQTHHLVDTSHFNSGASSHGQGTKEPMERAAKQKRVQTDTDEPTQTAQRSDKRQQQQQQH